MKFWCEPFNNTIWGTLCFATPTKKLCARGRKNSKGSTKKG